ncbi:hypothetical protein BJV78DRAFT_1134057, partial [Lactifluus subvellereus]
LTDAGPNILLLGTVTTDGFKTLDYSTSAFCLTSSHLLSYFACIKHQYSPGRGLLNEIQLIVCHARSNSRYSQLSIPHGDGLETICAGPMDQTGPIQPRIYVPYGEPSTGTHYREIATEGPHNEPDVQDLQSNLVDPHLVKSVSSKEGIFALTMNSADDGCGDWTLKGILSFVPDARSTRCIDPSSVRV